MVSLCGSEPRSSAHTHRGARPGASAAMCLGMKVLGGAPSPPHQCGRLPPGGCAVDTPPAVGKWLSPSPCCGQDASRMCVPACAWEEMRSGPSSCCPLTGRWHLSCRWPPHLFALPTYGISQSPFLCLFELIHKDLSCILDVPYKYCKWHLVSSRVLTFYMEVLTLCS